MVVTLDGRTLIIAESCAARLTGFGIDADGGMSGRGCSPRVWGQDGICMDAEGAVWVGTG